LTSTLSGNCLLKFDNGNFICFYISGDDGENVLKARIYEPDGTRIREFDDLLHGYSLMMMSACAMGKNYVLDLVGRVSPVHSI
jgi:hypothetical protein